MSLRVWLPLNGSLENKGLDDVTVTNNGAVVDNNGKIGKCYSFDGSNDKLILTSNKVYETAIGSIACWIKLNALPSSSGFYALGQIGALSGYAGCRLGLYFEYSNKINVSINGSNTGSNIYVHSLQVNEWYHLCATYDGTLVKLYLNGNEVMSKTASVSSYKTNTSNIYVGGTSSYYFNGKMNDFRIYDHALSLMEVKQISQGLVLHYPLNHGGLGQENLLKNSHIKYDNNGYYVGTYAFADSSKLETGKTYTLSFNGELQDDSQTGWYFNIFPSPYTPIINKTTDKEGRFAFSFIMPENGGSRTDIGCYSKPLGNRLGCAIWNVKLEEGSIATPWSPASSDDLYSTIGGEDTIEYDCSGYGNNGTRTGTFSWTSDTPKYSVSTHIGTTSSKIHISNFPTSGFGNTYSFAWWGKRNANSPMFWGFSDGIRLNGMYLGTFWNTGDGNSNPIYKPNTTTTITAPSLNVWHHYVMTGDGSVCKLYIDGEFYGRAKAYKAISGTSIYINGWDAGASYCSNNTDISDFRIYATALSPEDVLDLYNLGAAIDTNNNLYGTMLEEV